MPGNLDSLGLFRERVLRYWGQALQRRSQIRRYAWVRRLKLAALWLPTPSVLHPWPLDRLPPIIRDKSRMRRRARTDLCGLCLESSWNSVS